MGGDEDVWGTYTSLFLRQSLQRMLAMSSYTARQRAMLRRGVGGGPFPSRAYLVLVGHDHRVHVRLDAYLEDGYGGQRVGGVLGSFWRFRPRVDFFARASVIRFEEDLRAGIAGTNLGTQLGSRYQLNEGVAATLLVEENSNVSDRFQLGIFAMMDLAFQPET